MEAKVESRLKLMDEMSKSWGRSAVRLRKNRRQVQPTHVANTILRSILHPSTATIAFLPKILQRQLRQAFTKHSATHYAERVSLCHWSLSHAKFQVQR
jgi:hypothetical protein